MFLILDKVTGIVRDAIISAGMILLLAGGILIALELILLGAAVYLSGILLLAIADNVASENATFIDYGFYCF